MGIDHYNCNKCEEEFPDCYSFSICGKCESYFCCECEEEQIKTYGVFDGSEESEEYDSYLYPEENYLKSCCICNLHKMCDKDVLKYILNKYNINLKEIQSEMRKIYKLDLETKELVLIKRDKNGN